MYRWDISHSKNYDCSKYTCPQGEDPENLSGNEVPGVQRFTCAADGGTFIIQFRNQRTSSISFDASTNDVVYALRRVNSVMDASVVFSTGQTACSGMRDATISSIVNRCISPHKSPLTHTVMTVYLTM